MNVIGKVLGNLKIISKIGEGGMGVVYLAEHITLKNRFAVKCLTASLTEDSGFRGRFYQEAVNHALLDHQNIVKATDFFEEGGQFFFVMEYVSGQSLNELIKKAGHLSEEEALRIFKDILRGLNFAHSKGVIHRDIKPSNVIVDESGRARITDFGIAILVGDKRLTAAGTPIGTAVYMSPEQILHPSEIDHRSDVYSAGIVLYEMLTGDVPFDGETEFAIQSQQVKDPVPDPILKNAQITPELKKIMLKALEKAPDMRFSGCGEFLKQIEEYEKKFDIGPERPWTLSKLLIMVVAVVFIGAVAYWFVIGLQPQPLPPNGTDSAYLWIESATEKASILCREIETLKRKQDYVKGVKDSMGDISELDEFKRQIKDHEKNVNEYLGGYLDYIRKLGSVEEAIVNKELKKYDEQLAQKEFFPKIKISQIVLQHYQEARTKAPINVNSEKMGELCPKQ
jgi:tRNA A-37 threonylcarbamoyl transferase component Bud32